MIKKYYDTDCNLGLLDGKTVAIMGFGSQGHAHAQNLHESGVNVIVGLRRAAQAVLKLRLPASRSCPLRKPQRPPTSL